MMMFPGISACLQCVIDSVATRTGVATRAVCSLPGTLRSFQDCVVRAYIAAQDAGTAVPDVATVHSRALQIAEHNSIVCESVQVTSDVLHTIVPTVSCTNALVAAVAVQEYIKFLTSCVLDADGYFLYVGDASVTGVSSLLTPFRRISNCSACSKFQHFKVVLVQGRGVQVTSDVCVRLLHRHSGIDVCVDWQLWDLTRIPATLFTHWDDAEGVKVIKLRQPYAVTCSHFSH
uniref:NEDD8-activating enzyme E1 catalytic subunit n=1 Tax=Lygus hesperus TaxID=30085 RepID=A0A0A9YVS4_LYGHE